MAEIEITSVAVPEESPGWFKSWAGMTNARLIKLFRSLNRLTVANLSSGTYSVSATHGRTLNIPHNLNREPLFIQKGSGRILYFQTVSTTFNKVVLIPYLASTVTVETGDKQKKRIQVADSSIFKAKDLVKIDGAERKIQNISGNILTLSDKVDLRTQKTVTLARDIVTFLIL